jgi:hypothetical protein
MRARLKQLGIAVVILATSLDIIPYSRAASTFNAESSVTQPEDTELDSGFPSIQGHLRQDLSDELLGNFNLFVYVDKAVAGPYAQRMFVFQKSANGDLFPLYDWLVSTGREAVETDSHGHLQSSRTPVGFFELDPKRYYRTHTSFEWNEAMPYAMFFSWHPQRRETGLAIHGVDGPIADSLGHRASGGCIRLSTAHARILHDLIQLKYWGRVPALLYRNEPDEISSDGLLQHDSTGRIKFERGYSVLVVIDDPGEQEQISSAPTIPFHLPHSQAAE